MAGRTAIRGRVPVLLRLNRVLGRHAYPIGTTLFASICASGHVIERDRETVATDTGFCTDCGAEVLAECATCSEPLPGVQFRISTIVANAYRRSSFCARCGAAHPWQAAAMRDADELIDRADTIPAAEKESLKQDMRELAREAPPATIERVKHRLGALLNDSGARQVIVNVLSEAAKAAMR